MSDFELYVSHSIVFSGYQRSFEQADYVVIGVPFDVTSTYRTGARFAPLAIRQASLNIETYSFRSNLDIENLKIHDLGDLHTSNNVETTLKRIERIVKDLLKIKKIPMLVGGEHTLTLGAMRGIGGLDTAVISLDAHLDLRNDYLGLSVSHTTFMRRIKEDAKPAKILEIGTRAVCREELDYAKESGIDYLPVHQIREDGAKTTAETIRDILRGYEKVYVTIDMDVLDPAFVPAVQNPEPEGLDTTTLLDLLGAVCDRRVIGVDLVEVAPHYDLGLTAIQAAKVLFEVLCCLEKTRKG